MMAAFWQRAGLRFLPFADAASAELPLGRLLRLSLFQLAVGLSAVLLTGTLNRVMIVELGLPAALVALMVALPILAAPFRALMGHRSDGHVSALGWRRVPYLWFGSLMQFGGLAIMPFALLLMTGDGALGGQGIGTAAAALAFLLAGAGMHLTQTAGLALATDLAPAADRPRVVALLQAVLLAGMLLAGLVFAALLADFTPTRLIQLVQGVALATLILNVIALWKQEARRPRDTGPDRPRIAFADQWRQLAAEPGALRLLAAVGLGAAGFAMQDVLLEPFAGAILGMGVGATTLLSALWAAGALAAFMVAARRLGGVRQADPLRLAAVGALAGIGGLAALILSAPLMSPLLLWAGTLALGFGGGLFGVGTLVRAMDLAAGGRSGIALGAWGAVHASAAGLGIVAAGLIRDGVSALGARGALGPALATPASGYSVVWHLEILLLFATLVAIGPLVRRAAAAEPGPHRPFGLAELAA